MVKSKALSKTCSSCGQQKPLSAFLQITGPEGTTYSSLCATCRKTEHDKPQPSREIEEGTTTTLGLKIDSKAIVHRDIMNREQFKQTEEDYFKERDKEEEIQDEEVKITQHTAKEEKKHRESFLRKASFLDSTDKAKRASETQQIFGSEAHKAKEAEIGLDATSDMQMGKMKYKHSEALKFYIAWSGATPLARATKQPAEAPKATSKEKTGAPDKNTLTDYVKDTWGPNSRRR